MQKIKTLWTYLLTRLEEPSTYAGGSVLATLVAAVFPGHLGTAILGAMAAIGAVLAIVIPEKKPTVIVNLPEGPTTLIHTPLVVKP